MRKLYFEKSYIFYFESYERNIVVKSQGAQCIFLATQKEIDATVGAAASKHIKNGGKGGKNPKSKFMNTDGEPLPLIIQKRYQ